MFIVVKSIAPTLTFYCADAFSFLAPHREEATFRCTLALQLTRQDGAVLLQYINEKTFRELTPGIYTNLWPGFTFEVYPAHDDTAIEARALAANEKTPTRVLSELLTRFDLLTHEALAKNPNIPPSLMDVLCFTHPVALAKNPSWALWLLEDDLLHHIPKDALLHFLIHGELHEELLFAILARCSPAFRRDFAASDAPPGDIKRMCQKEDEAYLRPLLQRLAKTPNSREEHLFAILQRLSQSARMQLSRDSNIQENIKVALAYDPEEDVRLALLTNLLKLPEEALQTILNDKGERTQRAFREALTTQYFAISTAQIEGQLNFSLEAKARSQRLLSLWNPSWGTPPLKAGDAHHRSRALCVVMKEKGGETKRVTFEKTVVRVGRVVGNDLVIPAGNVSKKHCILFHNGDRCYIADAMSTGGTMLNHQYVRGLMSFGDNDILRLGGYEISVEFIEE
jgi:hypothetical protein